MKTLLTIFFCLFSIHVGAVGIGNDNPPSDGGSTTNTNTNQQQQGQLQGHL